MIHPLIRNSAAMFFYALLVCGLLTKLVMAAEEQNTFSGVFSLYEDNRKQNIGNYITPDLAVVSYSLLKNNLMMRREQQVLAPQFKTLMLSLYEKSAAAESMLDASVSTANHDFLSIILSLIDPEKQIPLSETAQQELSLIQQAKGITNSPLWQYKLDYSQMKVRGHYSQTKVLGRYFQSMRYANTVLLPFVVSEATQVTAELQTRFIAQAQQLSELLYSDYALLSDYKHFNQQLDWSVGPKEDFDMISFKRAQESCNSKEKELFADCLINYAKKNALVPKIPGQPVQVSQLKPNEKIEQLLIGFRLFASRYTIDSDLMQNVVYKKTALLNYEGDKQFKPFSQSTINSRLVKGYPMLDELMQLSGSTIARLNLENEQDTRYKGYAIQIQKNAAILKHYLNRNDASSAEWKFMQSVFKVKVNTQQQVLNHTLMRVFWTWSRYQQQLYAKQSYTPDFKSMPPPETRNTADIQPAALLYEALAELITLHEQQTKEKKWSWLLADVKHLAELSKKRENHSLSKQDMYYLNELDRRLKAIVKQNDQAIVVDVHTNMADKLVLQEATGNAVSEIHTVNKVRLRGARLSHYEFKQPIDKRLTDERWREQLIQQRNGQQRNETEIVFF